MPLILIATVVVGATAVGAASRVGGNFCFSGETPIRLNDGSIKRIDQIVIGDVLEGGSTVTAAMVFATDRGADFYKLDGIAVSGSHIVYLDGRPVMVSSLDQSLKISAPDTIYCLNTSNHRILIDGLSGVWSFADWEELENGSMADWERLVQKELNGIAGPQSSDSVLESESGIDAMEPIELASGETVDAANIKMGDLIRDGAGFTRVTGLVILDGSETGGMGRIGDLFCSSACWIWEGSWIRAAASKRWVSHLPVKTMRMFTTESGSFSVSGVRLRDFTDVGMDKIEKTYGFTINQISRGVGI